MKKLLTALFLSVTTLTTIAANAGTPALGFEVGASTLEQVKSKLAKQTKVVDAGLNKYSDGPMLRTEGDSYEITGLKSVLYIFDNQKKLAALIMNMDKGKFQNVYDALEKKYKVSDKQRPFVGNQFVRFQTADSVVELDAPHMGFDMEVRYIQHDLNKKFKAQSAQEAADKSTTEASKF